MADSTPGQPQLKSNPLQLLLLIPLPLMCTMLVAVLLHLDVARPAIRTLGRNATQGWSLLLALSFFCVIVFYSAQRSVSQSKIDLTERAQTIRELIYATILMLPLLNLTLIFGMEALNTPVGHTQPYSFLAFVAFIFSLGNLAVVGTARVVWERLPRIFRRNTVWFVLSMCLIPRAVFAFDPIGFSRFVGVAGVVVLGVAALFFVLDRLLFGVEPRLDGYRSWIFLPLALFLFLSGDIFKGPVPIRHVSIPVAVSGAIGSPTDPFGTWARNRDNPRYAFERWLKHRQGAIDELRNERRYPVFIVAAEGGGIRAAYWTGILLANLEDRYPGFHCHVFAISSVSGGSLGAAAYVSSLARRYDSGKHPFDCQNRTASIRSGRTEESLSDDINSMLSSDFLSPSIAGLVMAEMLPLASFGAPGRIAALERAWEVAWDSIVSGATGASYFTEDFRNICRPRGEYILPYLIISATDVAESQPATFSCIAFDGITGPMRNVGLEPLAITDVFASSINAPVAMSTVVGVSARFPFISPPALADDKRLLVDGGFIDNGGLWMATVLRDSIEPIWREHAGSDNYEVILLRIVNSGANSNRVTLEDINEPAAVYEALMGVRSALGRRLMKEAVVEFGNDRVVTLALPSLEANLGCISGEKKVVAEAVIPLSWTLPLGGAEVIAQLADDTICSAPQKLVNEFQEVNERAPVTLDVLPPIQCTVTLSGKTLCF